jgi:hypothetical protein
VLFSREDLFETLPNSWHPLRMLVVRRFWEDSSEELLEVHRCNITEADSACHFCIESVRNTRHPPENAAWQTYGKNLLVQPIDVEEMKTRLNEIRGNRWSDALKDLGEMSEAIKLFDDWNLWWVTGRAESDWFAIYWETTA